MPNEPKLDSLTLTSAMLDLIAELDEFKGTWRYAGNLAPERLPALRRVATIESVGSSTRIEGSRLSDAQVEALLRNLEIRQFDTRDAQEVAGYAEAMELVFRASAEISLTENHIRQLHRDLLQFSEKDAHHRGTYKTLPNSVAAFDDTGAQVGIVFETASPFETPGLMRDLVGWTSETLESRSLHPLLTIGIFIVLFLEIHPFQDGNGRLSRILTTLLLLRAGYAYVPYSSLESVIEQRKEAYYLALRQTQSTIRTERPNWQPWLLFFLGAMHMQMRTLAKKMGTDDILASLAAPAIPPLFASAIAGRESLLLADMPQLSAEIVLFARTHGRVTIAAIVKQTGRSRNTIKQHFRQLRAAGRISQHGRGRGSWYTLC